MMQRLHGLTLVEALIGVTVLVLVGLVGYNLVLMQQSRDATVSEQQSIADGVPEAPEINETSDLDKAAATLDQINPEANDVEAAELDSETAF